MKGSCIFRMYPSLRTSAWTAVILTLGGLLADQVDAQPGGLERARQAEQRRIEIIEQVVPATISVFSTDGQGGGSGVVVTPDGYALTNYHVVDPCGSYMHCSMPDGRLYDAVLVGIDPVGDVAMIKLLGRDDFPAATMADSDLVRAGDFCFAAGNPFLLADNFQPSVSWGIVSGIHRYQYPAGTLLEYADSIQTDAAINPGNSGGPLFNGRGELIGINGRGSFEKRGRVNVGVGYAISINQIKLFWDHLASGRIVDHATLGATVVADRNGQVTVGDILPTSDVWRRGLRYGDQLVAIDGRRVTTVNEFKNILGIYPAGWRIALEYRRDGRVYTVPVRLPGLHTPQKLAAMVQRRQNQRPEILPQGPPQSPASPPDSVQAFIEDRPGFANYHFNRLQQERIWTGFQQLTGPGLSVDQLRLTGQRQDGTPVQIALASDKSGIRWADQAKVLDPGLDLALQSEPAGSGGLLPALHLWFRLLQNGPAAMGDIWYLGKLPSGPGQPSVDVLVCNTDGVQLRFLFDPDSHCLTGVEYLAAPDQDPTEIRFSEYQTAGENALPRRILVDCGESFHWELQFDTVTGGPE